MASRIDIWEVLSRWAIWLAFGLAALVFLASPVLAIGWARLPFPGFLFHSNLVVETASRPAWVGHELGLTFPQHVLRFAGETVERSSDVRRVLAGLSAGSMVPVFVEFPDGTQVLHLQVPLVEFSTADLWALFWLPYLIGLGYLGIGYWLYRVAGRSRHGRAISFFCACTALSTTLIFDLWTTHAATALWSLALALAGGALISLALRFPLEWKPVENSPWLLALPYGISILLALYSWIESRNTANPLALFRAWNSIYNFAGLAILFFLGLTAYRGSSSQSPLVRRQARVVLAGSMVAFIPVTAWFLAPIFRIELPFNAPILLPPLLLFPVAVSLAALRYRLWQIDTLVNKAVVYGALTATLAGVFTALIGLSQWLFVQLTGEESDAALILTTLIVASAVAPIRSRLHVFVDRRFREAPADSSQLAAFDNQVQVFLEMNDPQQLARRLLQESVEAVGALSGALRLMVDGQNEELHMLGPWRGEAVASIPLRAGQQVYGQLQLGPRKDQTGYSTSEIETIEKTAQRVAEALRLSASDRSVRT